MQKWWEIELEMNNLACETTFISHFEGGDGEICNKNAKFDLFIVFFT